MVRTRRTIVVESNLDLRIKELLQAAHRNGVNLEYNTAVNLFAELGEKWLGEAKLGEQDAQYQILSKYLDLDTFKASIKNDWLELEEFRNLKQGIKEEESQDQK